MVGTVKQLPFWSHLGTLQVFASYSANASPALLQICATALSNIIYAKKDRVFHQSKEAKETWMELEELSGKPVFRKLRGIDRL